MSLVDNVFCATGKGGKVDPHCGKGGKRQAATVSPRDKYVGQTVGASEHAHAAESARSLARALGGVTEAETADAGQKDKKPYDVRVPKADGSGDHDLEVKTLLKGSKQELSVHEDALLRKVRHAEANPDNTFHTVARDDRDRYGGGAYAANYSGHGLYYKRGSGRYRLSQMHRVKDEAELKTLLDMPDDQLPEKARGSLPPPPPVASLEAKAQKAHAQRYARDRARKDRNREKLREQARAQRMARRGARAEAEKTNNVENVFCRTGPGGGIKPDCSPNQTDLRAEVTVGSVVSSAKSEYPRVKPGNKVDGRDVIRKIDNQGSIASSLDRYEVLPGIREVRLDHFQSIRERRAIGQMGGERRTAADDERKVAALAEKIRASGRISPLIVVDDGHPDGPYVLEGGHRIDALERIGAKSVPALVVVDLDGVADQLRGGHLPDRLSRTKAKGVPS